MGLIVDRIAETVGSLRRLQRRLVQAGNDDAAVELQSHLIEPLNELLVEVDGSPVDERAAEALSKHLVTARRDNFPRSRGGKGYRGKGRKRPGKITWLCCYTPRRSMGFRGKPVWVADCRWKKKSGKGLMTGQSPRRIADGKSPKPREVRMKGRVMKRCQKSAAKAAPKRR